MTSRREAADEPGLQPVPHELGTEAIAALWPRARGRIERLRGTPQGRLAREMRRAGIAPRQQANAFPLGFTVGSDARLGKEPQGQQAARLAALPVWTWAITSPPKGCACLRPTTPSPYLSFEERPCRPWTEPTHSGASACERVWVHQVPEGDLSAYEGKRRLLASFVGSAPAQTSSRCACATTGSGERSQAGAERRGRAAGLALGQSA